MPYSRVMTFSMCTGLPDEMPPAQRVSSSHQRWGSDQPVECCCLLGQATAVPSQRFYRARVKLPATQTCVDPAYAEGSLRAGWPGALS